MNYCFKRALVAPFLTFMLFVYALPIFGQAPSKVIPPSPNASSLGKYGEIPVGTYTGTPQISLPIGEAKGKQLSVPVSLSYHASGIKVDDVASQVGLGWSLNCGGVITRTIKGLPDESTWGFANYTFDPQNDANLESALLNLIDTEPDAFFFNVNGYSGKFYLDKVGSSKVVRLIPYQDIKLEFIEETTINSRWLMTTPDGSKYFFNTPEYNNTNLENGGTRADITSWYLTKIEGLTGDIANFSYLQGETIGYRPAISETLLIPSINNSSACYQNVQANFNPFTRPVAVTPNHILYLGKWSFDVSDGAINTSNTGLQINSPLVQNNPLYIDEITTYHNKIKFTYTNDRQDFTANALALQKVTISNKNYANNTFLPVKKVNLDFNYFDATDGNSVFNNERDLRRLKLVKLTEIGIATDGTEMPLPAHELEYYEDGNTNLPARLSAKQDHWGYANQNPAQSLIPRNLSNPRLYNKGDRSADEVRCVAGTIKKIKYPTGGFTEFEFEAHKTENSPALRALSTAQFVRSVESAIADFSYTNSPNENSTIIDVPGQPTEQVVDIEYALALGTYGTPEYFGYVKIDKIDANGNIIANILDFGNGAPGTNNEQNPTGILKTTRTLSAGRYKLTAYAQRQEVGFPERSTITVSYYRVALQQTAQPINVPIGGVRVKRVKTYENANSQPIVKRYEYSRFNDATKSSGELIALPKYDYALKFAIICQGGGIGLTPSVPYECGNCWVNGLVSASKVPLGASQGSHIVYTNIAIFNGENGEGGKNEMTYSYYPDQLNYDVPFAQHDSYEWRRGNVEKQIDYKNVDNNYVEIKRVTNEYIYGRYGSSTSNSVNSHYTKGYVVGLDYVNRVTRPAILANVTKINSYIIHAPWVSLESSTVIQDGVTTVTTNTYDEANGRHAQAKTVRIINSNGQELRTETVYSKDLTTSTDAGIILCNQLNMLVPIEQKNYTGTTLIGGTKNKYEPTTVNTQNIPLQTQWIGILRNNAEEVQATATYYADGFLKNVLKKGFWITKNYLWENGLPKSETFGSLTSSATYKPNSTLLESVTDENGFKSKFYYDPLQRLEKAESYFADNTLRSTTTQNYTFGNGSATNPNKINSTTIFKDIPDPLSTTQYFDGLGRPIEVVKESYTPKVAPHENTAWHQKSYITYDALGRQDKSYQPFESATIGLETTIPSGTPFVYPQYEASPLSRPLKKYAEDGKYVQMDYAANTSAEVRQFSVNTEGFVSAVGYFDANLLYKTTITNENGTTNAPNGNINKTDIFKDKLGRVLLTRKFLDNTEGGKVDTYNVYDDYGNLVMVIPPGAIVNNNIQLDLVFTYKYNNKNLLCEKKIPGADCQKFFYDSRDLLVLTQDGNMRTENSQKHIATQYDALGRVLITGYWFTATPETVADNVSFATWNNLLTQNYYDATKNRLTNQLTYVLNKAGVPEKWLSSYFSYNDKGEMIYSGKDNLEGANVHYYEYNTAGKSIRHETYHWGRNGGQYSHSYQSTYDHALRNKANTLYFWGASVATPLPTMQLSAFTYNYKDQVIEKNIGRNEWVWGAKALQSIDYQYNQRGWLTEINQQPLSYHNMIVRTKNGVSHTYPDPNPTFRIMDGENSVDLFSESIRYATPDVNLSNLATPQYNGNISQAVWQVAGREQQAYTYKYDDLDRLLEGEYTDIHDLGGYIFDNQQPYSTDNKFGEKLTYDLRGNILSLQRNGMIAPGMSGGSIVTGTFGQIDNLAYTYNTKNQVTAIADAANATKGFKGNSSAYTYDANGNLKTDVAKGITSIVYNYLNLPQTIEFTNNHRIEFIYDATGMKLRKTTYENNIVKETRDYMGGFEYKDDKIERIHHAEGVITQRPLRSGESTEFVGAGGLVWQYEYTLKDHLGNTRVTFADIDGSRTIDPHTEINQINHYYPFGLNMEGNWNGASAEAKNKYQYNGKELQTDFGLDWNDYGARFYDFGRNQWTTIDPLAEKGDHKQFNPYCYVNNNPIKFIDPNGMDNILYILTLKGVSDDLVKAGIDKANEYFSLMGLQTRAVRAESNFDLSKLDKTDGMVLIGNTKQQVAKYTKSNEFLPNVVDADFLNAGMDRWIANSSNPEVTSGKLGVINAGNLKSFINALSGLLDNGKAKITLESPSEALGLIMVHSAGHQAGSKHDDDDPVGELAKGFMANGNMLVTLFSGSTGTLQATPVKSMSQIFNGDTTGNNGQPRTAPDIIKLLKQYFQPNNQKPLDNANPPKKQ